MAVKAIMNEVSKGDNFLLEWLFALCSLLKVIKKRLIGGQNRQTHVIEAYLQLSLNM